MVKINSPLMSIQASGKIGERLVFSKRGSGQQARFQKAQKDVSSADRVIQRSAYSTAVLLWNGLTQEQKNVYIDNARNKHYTGYNLFLMQNIISFSDSFYGVALYGSCLFGSN